MKKGHFNLSYDHLTSFDMGELVPIGLRQVVQGDVWKMNSSAMVRCAPMTAPPMHPTHATIHHWFIPHRLVWDDTAGANTGFEAFITGGPAGTSAPTHPTITLPNSGAGGVVEGSLANYLGVPIGNADGGTGYVVNALPFRAYNLVWNHFYRDEDLETAAVIDLTDGADTTTSTTLKHVCWEKDYFTSSRPSPQKGTAISLPLGSTAPVVTTGVSPKFSGLAGVTATNDPLQFTDVTNKRTFLNSATGTGEIAFGTPTGLQTDLTGATAASISALRLASWTQKMLENNMRHGSRFIEYLRRMGIKSSDARLQLPEYLGGGKQTVQFSEVLATSNDADNGLGTMGGHGIAATRSNRFVRFFEEPGFVLSLMYVVPKTIYLTGLERHWNMTTKFDYFQPELQFIGQQAVLNKEIYASGANPNSTFGYQDRYDELRRSESRISGAFLGDYLNWHFGRDFVGLPTLNGSFVSAVPTAEPFADQNADTLLAFVHHSIRAKRLVSNDATPRLS